MCNQEKTVYPERLVPQDGFRSALAKAMLRVHPDQGGSREATELVIGAKERHESAMIAHDGDLEQALLWEMPGLLHWHRRCKGRGCTGCHNTGLKLS